MLEMKPITAALPFLFQSHTMRNGVLAVIGEVVSHEMSEPTSITDQQRDTRDHLLDKLQVLVHCACRCTDIKLLLCMCINMYKCMYSHVYVSCVFL